MRKIYMRSAMAMIELIFAIVIIAISILSIPSMLNVAEQASKISIIDDDVMSRMMGWVIDKSQARWDANYSASDSSILWIAGTADMNCSRGSGTVWYRDNNESMIQCHGANIEASIIPVRGNGLLSQGIEQLNEGNETLIVAATTGENYDINVSYTVRYVESNITVNNNVATASWRLGSSSNMTPDGATGTLTHLKRVVTRFTDPETQTDTVLTFFKSNKGN